MASVPISATAPPPGTLTHLPSMNPTFCSVSLRSEASSSGRSLASVESSAARAERLAERTDMNVATARNNVAPAVASEETVDHKDTHQLYGQRGRPKSGYRTATR